MARSRTQNRLIVIGILALPVAAFLLIQVLATRAQPGQLLDVRLVTSPQGHPVAVGIATVQSGARIRMMDGSNIEQRVQLKKRLVQLDLRSGEWIARETVDRELELFGVTEAAFWFRERGGAAEGEPKPRDPLTLQPQPGDPPVPSRGLPPRPAALSEGFTLPDGQRVITAELGGKDLHAPKILFDERTGSPFSTGTDGEYLLVAGGQRGVRNETEDVLYLVRVGVDGEEKWRTRLALQRHVWGATRVKDQVVIVTGGMARDFAFSVSLADGKVEWVEGF